MNIFVSLIFGLALGCLLLVVFIVAVAWPLSKVWHSERPWVRRTAKVTFWTMLTIYILVGAYFAGSGVRLLHLY
jgi:hypothetical protein